MRDLAHVLTLPHFYTHTHPPTLTLTLTLANTLTLTNLSCAQPLDDAMVDSSSHSHTTRTGPPRERKLLIQHTHVHIGARALHVLFSNPRTAPTRGFDNLA